MTLRMMIEHHDINMFMLMKIFKFFRNTYMTEKETPLVGVEPDASHLLDECPRLLDHRGYLICHRSLIQVIHVWSLNCDYQLFTRMLMLHVILCRIVMWECKSINDDVII